MCVYICVIRIASISMSNDSQHKQISSRSESIAEIAAFVDDELTALVNYLNARLLARVASDKVHLDRVVRQT